MEAKHLGRTLEKPWMSRKAGKKQWLQSNPNPNPRASKQAYQGWELTKTRSNWTT